MLARNRMNGALEENESGTPAGAQFGSNNLSLGTKNTCCSCDLVRTRRGALVPSASFAASMVSTVGTDANFIVQRGDITGGSSIPMSCRVNAVGPSTFTNVGRKFSCNTIQASTAPPD